MCSGLAFYPYMRSTFLMLLLPHGYFYVLYILERTPLSGDANLDGPERQRHHTDLIQEEGEETDFEIDD